MAEEREDMEERVGKGKMRGSRGEGKKSEENREVNKRKGKTEA